MHDRTEQTNTAVMQRPTDCPAWCLGGHEDQLTDFHHMGDAATVVPALQPLRAPHQQEVRVLPSAYVEEDGSSVRPALVELRIGEGTSFTLAELTPAEAVQVAHGLLQAAELAKATGPAPATEAHAERPWWQSEPCPSWCGFSHRPQDAYDDRIHYSGEKAIQERRIVRTLDEAFIRTPEADTEVEVATLDVFLRQHYRETGPRLALSFNEEPSIELTVAEARELRRHLDELIEQATHV